MPSDETRPFSYIDAQFAKLGENPPYALVKIASGESGRTHWLRITPEALADIKTVLKAHEEESTP